MITKWHYMVLVVGKIDLCFAGCGRVPLIKPLVCRKVSCVHVLYWENLVRGKLYRGLLIGAYGHFQIAEALF